jgi:hypothetical protein
MHRQDFIQWPVEEFADVLLGHPEYRADRGHTFQPPQ